MVKFCDTMSTSTLATMLLTLSTIVVTTTYAGAERLMNADDIVNVQQLPHTSGFYYQPINKMHFVESLWTFVIEMDHGAIFLELDTLYKETQHFVEFLNTQPVNNCSSKRVIQAEVNTFIVKQILALVQKHNDLDSKIPKAGEYDDHDNLMLQDVQAQRATRRQKRGILNFVGSIDKFLFGVMDQNDANLLHKLAKSDNALNNQVKQLTDELISLSSYMEHSQCVEQHQNDACIYIDSKMNLLKAQIDEIDLLYTNLDRAVDNALVNKVNSLIMTPKRLLKELTSVTKYLPPKTAWPVSLELDNMHNLINNDIIKSHVFLTKDRKLLFILEMPLIGQQLYNVYQVVPIPFCVNSKCAVIVPDSKYLAVSSNRQSYARLEDDTTKVCKTAIGALLCFKPKIVHDASQATLCDIKILLDNNAADADTVVKNCDVRVGHFDVQIFHPISYYNNWLYVLQKDTRVDFDCSADVSVPPVVLKTGVGILRGLNLNFTCKLVTSKMELTVVQMKSKPISISILPISTSFNLSATLTDLDTFELNTFKSNDDLDHKNLNGMTERLIDLRKRMENNTVYTGGDIADDETTESWFCWFVSFFGLSCRLAESIVATVVLIVVFLFVYKIYRCLCPGLCSGLCSGFCTGLCTGLCSNLQMCRRATNTVVRVNENLQYATEKKSSKYPTVHYHAGEGQDYNDSEQVFIKQY
ncbi:fusion protein [Orgyia leucostigma nucleopolyhedrovirus]|uniref:Fusion protein n=1 Tax=Orgyia leucostigma nucleopolyhedrovirus TaxID=490711 RepID=B0FDZ5_9ABAC|nr:fusion protein [Orgyia leucostigma nucleopolyhedrovirus]ABY65853.1 fusion protein [Orgyia leucostigma nucleopolyhedrovirus]